MIPGAENTLRIFEVPRDLQFFGRSGHFGMESSLNDWTTSKSTPQASQWYWYVGITSDSVSARLSLSRRRHFPVAVTVDQRPGAYHQSVSPYWILVPLGYALGMFQSAEVVGGFVGRDPRREGSRNPGASNMYRIAGRNAAGIVLAIDVLKGFIPAIAGWALHGTGLGLAAGAASVIGHVWPLIRRFSGGKGVATFAGVTVALFPWAAFIGLACWGVGISISRRQRAAVASLAGVAGTTVAMAAFGEPWWAIAGVGALGLLIVFRHRSNLSRLFHGEDESARKRM